jgi:hypothetical protein
MGSLLRVYKNRLNRTNVEIPFEDETVTSACYSETNNVLFLGTSKGQVRFVNLLECLEVDTEQELRETPVELDAPFQMADQPITDLTRFKNRHVDDNKESSVILVTVGANQLLLFDFLMPSCEKNVRPIDLSLGPEGTRFDPEGMQICNTFIALNSNYFAVGLVRQDLLAGQLPRQDGKPVKNDKGSALGIFKIGKHKDSLFQSFKDGI